MNVYADWWDHYVNEVFPKRKSQTGADLKYAGYEWGAEANWKRLFENLFSRADVDSWKNAVELGSGAGKYTAMVLARNTDCKVYAYDVSQAFLDACGERLSSYREAGRLTLQHLKGDRPDELLKRTTEHGLSRNLDALFSIDAMVHVDLQYLIVYFVTAALQLRPGGKLVITLADATSDQGFDKLMGDIRPFFAKQGAPAPKFEFLSPDIVTSVMARLGFEVDYLERARDMCLVASLKDLKKAEAFEQSLIRV